MNRIKNAIANKTYKVIAIIIILIVVVVFRENIENLLKPFPRLTTILSMVLTVTIAYLGFKKENVENDTRSQLIKSIIDLKIYKKWGSEKENKNLEHMNMQLDKIKNLKLKKGNTLLYQNVITYDPYKYLFRKEFTNEIAIFLRYYIDYEMEDWLYNIVLDLESELTETRNIELSENYRNEYKEIVMSIDEIIRMFDKRKVVISGGYDTMYENLKKQDGMENTYTRKFLNIVYRDIENLSDSFNRIYEYHEDIRGSAFR